MKKAYTDEEIIGIMRGYEASGQTVFLPIESWRKHYNTERPHSSLGYLTPIDFKC